MALLFMILFLSEVTVYSLSILQIMEENETLWQRLQLARLVNQEGKPAEISEPRVPHFKQKD